MENKIIAVLSVVLPIALFAYFYLFGDTEQTSIVADTFMVILSVSCFVVIVIALIRLYNANPVATTVPTPTDKPIVPSRDNAKFIRELLSFKSLFGSPVFLIILTALVAVGTFSFGLRIWGDWNDEWSGYNASSVIGDGNCNIAVIPIEGDIGIFGEQYKSENDVADADDIVVKIHQAEEEPGILGIMVRIDSSGGAPVASRLIMDAMDRSTIPVVAVIREIGTSGAYMAASGAEFIFADPMSDVGDIGITMSYLDNTEKNKKEGLTFVPLASAKYKDYGNPDKSLTKEERTLVERDLMTYHNEFVNLVARNRALPVEDVAKLADGSSLPGALALEHKLIDALGDQESARDWMAWKLDMPMEEVIYCE